MEDVLEVYHRQYGEQEVLVCLDEASKQQVQETRQPRPPRPGAARACDYEYRRNGVSSLFMLFAPLEGWRRVEVTDRRTRVDWARVVQQLVDVDYADKDRMVLVMDNLNTHHPASLYEAFEPAEARRIAERLEIHYTPKHGSWLNMAEIEIGVLSRQCLDRRIPDQEVLRREVEAWQGQRNREAVRVDWRFTTEAPHQTVGQAAALGVLRGLGMPAPGPAGCEGGGADRRQCLGAEGCRLLLGSPEEPSQAQHRLGDVGAFGSRPPRQLSPLDDGRPGLPDGGHPLPILRQADQVVADAGLQIVRQVEPLLLGPAQEPTPVAMVGATGVPGPGGLADLVAPGELTGVCINLWTWKANGFLAPFRY